MVVASVTENVGAQKFTHGLGIGDVNGDGRLDISWSQALVGGAACTWRWVLEIACFPPIGGGAQMFAYDFNGDGRRDLLSVVAAHAFGWRGSKQGGHGPKPPGRRRERRLAETSIVGQEPWENPYGVRFGQPHALALADVDGDGVADSSRATATLPTTATRR